MIPGKGLLIMKNTQFPYGLCVSKSGFLVFAEFLLAAGGNLLEMDWTMKFLFEFDRGSGRTIPTKNGICTISVANVSIGAHHHKNSRPFDSWPQRRNINFVIWVFPKIVGFPPKSSIKNRVFHDKPSILEVFPLFLETSIWILS